MRMHKPLPTKHGKPVFTIKRPFEGTKTNVDILNSMLINVTVCLSHKHTHSAPPPHLHYIRATSQLQVDSVKYLGVILTSDLT